MLIFKILLEVWHQPKEEETYFYKHLTKTNLMAYYSQCTRPKLSIFQFLLENFGMHAILF